MHFTLILALFVLKVAATPAPLPGTFNGLSLSLRNLPSPAEAPAAGAGVEEMKKGISDVMVEKGMAPVEVSPESPHPAVLHAGPAQHHNTTVAPKHHHTPRQLGRGFFAKARSFRKPTRAVRTGDYRSGEDGPGDAGQQSGAQGYAMTPSSTEATSPPAATKSAEIMNHGNA